MLISDTFHTDADISSSKEMVSMITTSLPPIGEFLARKKRSISGSSGMNANNAYTMEVLVAADKKMQEYHGASLNNYILTLMSIVSCLVIVFRIFFILFVIFFCFCLQVSSVYSDASIGNSINIAVVHVVLLKDDLVSNPSQNGSYNSGEIQLVLKRKCIKFFPADNNK